MYPFRLRNLNGILMYNVKAPIRYGGYVNDLQRENEQLRRLVGELAFGGKTHTGEKSRPTLDLPIPCECGHVIIQRLTFGLNTFKLTQKQPDIRGVNAWVEGTVVEVSFHGISQGDHFQTVCMKCGRDIAQG